MVPSTPPNDSPNQDQLAMDHRQTRQCISSTSPGVAVSAKGMIHVLGYTPTEGECGVPITVRIHFHPDPAQSVFIRLVVGHQPVATKVRELPNTTYGRWQLDASAPPYDERTPTKVLIAVQALNEDDAILDSVTFGEFSYWAPVTSPQLIAEPCVMRRDKACHPYATSTGPALRRRSIAHLPTPSPTLPHAKVRPQLKDQRTLLHRRLKTQTVMRSKGPDAEDLYPQTPVLDLVTPLTSLCTGWSPADVNAGRRLVRFSKIQEGRRLIVSCEPISQEEYCESDSVISCIYREETETCFVTSVDIIYLLERLTNDEFPVEEKNRIRRNLEGLRPTTVSKHKSGFEDFFQRIMDFPDPKPRNIEKDLKVFEWTLLGQALEKILSKYSIYTALPDSPASERSSTDDTKSSGMDEASLGAAPVHSLATGGAPTMTTAQSKYEAAPNVATFLSSEPEPQFHSTVPLNNPPISYNYAPAIGHGADSSNSANWPVDFKSAGDICFDTYTNMPSYDPIAEPVIALDGYSDDPTNGLPYDHYGFPAMSDDALAGIVEQYL